jgi:flagellar basal-body rod modification protein FlgD
MNGTNPIVTPPVGSTPATSTASSSQSSNLKELGPDAFITLLTAQLQAQDPLNPMDPNQMVNELTSMNTLQETIQIRQDMDSLVTSLQPAPASPTPNSKVAAGTGAIASLNLSPATAVSSAPDAAHPVAAAAISSGLAALVRSLAPSSTPSFGTQSNSQ